LFAFCVRTFLGVRVARLSVLAFACSPLALLINSSYMSHISFMFDAICCVYCIMRALPRTTRHRWWAVAAGCAFGCALITRFQDACLLGLLFVCVGCCYPKAMRPIYTRMMVGIVPLILIWLYWNQIQYGHPFYLGYGRIPIEQLNTIYIPQYESFHVMGFVHKMIVQLYKWSMVIFGCPLLLSFACVPCMWHRRRKPVLILALGVCINAALYLIYPYHGYELEARFFFWSLPLICCLIAIGIQDVLMFARRHRWGGWMRHVLVYTGMVSVCFSLFFYWPRDLWPKYAHDYEDASAALIRLVEDEGIADALVLIPSFYPTEYRYSSGFMWMDPYMKGSVVYARDLGQRNACLYEAYAGRIFYRVVGWGNAMRLVRVDRP